MAFSFPALIQAAISRLSSLYNGGRYDASANPGGLTGNGHRTNFVPALQDVAAVANAVAGAADAAGSAADTAVGAQGTTLAAAGSASTSAASALQSEKNAKASEQNAATSAANSQAASRILRTGDQMTGALELAPLVSMASAATTDIGAANSNHVEITGATVVTSFGNRAAGAIRYVRFANSGLLLTFDAIALILPGAANILTQAGDTAIFRSHGAGWRCLSYQRADGTALVAPVVPPAPTLDDFRTALIQIAKLKGSTVGMAGGIADDFKDQSGVDTAGSTGQVYDSTNGLYGNTQAALGYVDLPYATVISSGSIDGSTQYQPSNAFDGNTGTSWLAQQRYGDLAGKGWIGQDYGAGNPQAVQAFVYQSGSGSQNVSSVLLQWSDDFATWTTAATVSIVNTGPSTYNTPAAGSHRYWRILANSASQGGDAWNVSELKFRRYQDAATYALDLRSVGFAAQAVPTKGSVFALVKATAGAITANTNLVAKLSRDGGATYATATLVKTGTLSTGYDVYEANGFDISGQPSGASMKWRLQTVGTTLGVAVDAVVAQWG